MILRADPPLHLTYCTNIHPAEGWTAVDESLRRIAPALRARLSPSGPFGLGLRLGAREARELLEGDRLERFRAFLAEHDLYVAILNGFPYGPFHGEPVKTAVYAPDWRAAARVAYTNDLITILERLLPDGVGGGISTVPLSYKAWMQTDAGSGWEAMIGHLVDICERLARVRERAGKWMHLDIEPEPDCVLETTAETIEFFERRLRPAAPELARRLGVGVDGALDRLAEHIQVCFDCCHCAVEYENPIDALTALRRAGIRVGRVQLSSALTTRLPTDAAGAAAAAAHLARFSEPTYLHQVVERRDGELRRFPDLDVALPSATSARSTDREWRIHFHVPLFTADYEGLGSSQQEVAGVIAEARRAPFTEHLEIETYTWSVLPDGLKVELAASIAREYEWVIGQWTGTT